MMLSDDGSWAEGDTPRVLSRCFKFICEADLVRRFDDRRYFASSDDLSIGCRGYASTVDPSVSVDGGGTSFRRIASVYRSIFRSDFPSILRRLFASSSTACSDFPSDCRTSLISSLLTAALLVCIVFSSRSFCSSFLRTETWNVNEKISVYLLFKQKVKYSIPLRPANFKKPWYCLSVVRSDWIVVIYCFAIPVWKVRSHWSRVICC